LCSFRHFYSVARALLITNSAARTQVIIELIALAGPQLNDRALRTGTKTAIAFKTVAAGQAALRFKKHFFFCEPGFYLVEITGAQFGCQFRLLFFGSMGGIPAMQPFVGYYGVFF